jgi:ribosomal protein S18 acetylase RimI-like enzyme
MVCSLITLIPDDKGFKKVCDYLESTIVKENLSINGGTLNHHSLTYNSDVLLVAVVENIIIGYASLVKIQNTCYVYQIALKKEFQQKGIGTGLIKRAIDIAEDNGLDLTANVMDYNTNSKKMFTRLGFEKIGYTKENDGFYKYYQRRKTNDKKLSK